MRRLFVLIALTVFVTLPVVGCNEKTGNDGEVVDTTLNDAPPSSEQDSQLVNQESRPPVQLDADTRRSSPKRGNASLPDDDSYEADEEEPQRQVYNARPAASAFGDIRALFSADDYPASAQAAGAQGTAQATLTIGTDGRVVACNLIRSTGNGALDSATCNVLRRRARFTPARDSDGNPMTGTVTTPLIVWRLQG